MARVNDLVAQIEDHDLRVSLEREIQDITAQKKYGLVWENKTEKVAVDCERMLPVLRTG